MRHQPDLRRQPGPHVFVEDLHHPELSDDDAHHLTRALRVRDGDPLTISDGQGRWRPARFAGGVEPDGETVAIADPPWRILLASAVSKGAKPEMVVQKATEIGVDTIVVFRADHSIPLWDDDKIRRALGRLDRVAREAAMQSRQVRLPAIRFVPDLAAVLDLGIPMVRADFGGPRIDAEVRGVAIGPEGGWSDAEISLVQAHADLGPSVLRTETAAVVAAAQLVAYRHLARAG